MRAQPEGLRHALFEFRFNLLGRLSLREAGAVADAQDMRVDCESLLTEPAVEHDISRLAAHARQADEVLARVGNLAGVFVDQQLTERDHVLRLRIEQADGLDVILQPVFAQRQHLLRRLDLPEQRARGLVHADVGCLRRQRHGHDQLVGIAVFELGLGRGIVLRQPAEEFEDLVLGHIRVPPIRGARLPFPRARAPSLRGAAASHRRRRRRRYRWAGPRAALRRSRPARRSGGQQW